MSQSVTAAVSAFSIDLGFSFILQFVQCNRYTICWKLAMLQFASRAMSCGWTKNFSTVFFPIKGIRLVVGKAQNRKRNSRA